MGQNTGKGVFAMKRISAGLLTLALALFMTGCGSRDQVGQGVEPPPPAETSGAGQAEERAEAVPWENAVAGFGMELFQACFQGDNTLVSPLSAVEALAMAANGADGQTLAQMEEVLGIRTEQLNACLHDYVQALPSEEGNGVHLANGIWVNSESGLKVRPEFLQANERWHGAGAFETVFDSDTRDAVNAWVSDNTSGRIDGILDELSPDKVMILVNALAFDGQWEDIYREDQVQAGTFTAENGESQDVELMHSTEEVYLQDTDAVGFVKYYEGRDYAFAALLPEEGIPLQDYAASLTGERLRALLAEGERTLVEADIPKFTAGYGADLTGVLGALGMTDAFDGQKADFSRLAEAAAGELRIDQVQHRTFISVNEKGTEAGAATAVDFVAMSMAGPVRTVTLDRPFLYLLLDCEHQVPLFIGAMTQVG